MEYDVIIVGAGSSGAVLATRLSEDRSRSVLLLDAGPDYRTLGELPSDVNSIHEPSVTHHDWGFGARFVPGREAPLPRGKLVGGSLGHQHRRRHPRRARRLRHLGRSDR